jgi:hypothetical protein
MMGTLAQYSYRNNGQYALRPLNASTLATPIVIAPQFVQSLRVHVHEFLCRGLLSGSVPTMSTASVALTSSTSQTTLESHSSQQSQTTGNIQEESTTSSMSQSGSYETANEYVCNCAHSIFLVGSPQTTTKLQIGYLSKEEEKEAWEMDVSSQKQLSICYLSPTEEKRV